jgi:hypothetical protein
VSTFSSTKTGKALLKKYSLRERLGWYTVKKSFSIFPSPARISLTKLSLGGNNFYVTSLFPPRESLESDIPAGDGNIEKFFFGCSHSGC